MDKTRIKRCLQLLLLIKILAAILVAFSSFDLPHIWREIDTLSVSFRYYQRWALGLDSLPLVPAVLNSNTNIGYMPMEFPFLNLIMAPFFYFGPSLGKTLSCLALFSFHGLLLFAIFRTYRFINILGTHAGKAFLLLPLMGLSCTYFLKFIPDTISSLLVTLGLGICWHKPKISGSLLIALGLLIKPVSIVALCLGFAKKGWASYLRQYFLWYVLALIPSLIYYTYGISYLKDLQEGAARFFVEPRPPLTSLREFFSEPQKIIQLIVNNIWFPGAIFFLFILGPIKTRLFLILLIQIILVAALDGDHAFIHNYYFMGIMPIAMLIIWPLFSNTIKIMSQRTKTLGYKKFFAILMLLVFTIRFFEKTSFQIRSFFRESHPTRAASFKTCKSLKEELPNIPWGTNYGFRTTHHSYPHLGLCFGEREVTNNSSFGFYVVGEKIPKKCKPMAQKKGIIVVQCTST